MSRVLRRSWFFALLLAVCWIYAFIVSADLDAWPVYGSYHDYLAQGFLSGHLSIPLDPAPELLKAKDPYDYANINYWSLDASYYKGKYYIYWGPVPALLQAGAKWLLGIRGLIGDQYLAFGFHCLAFWSGALVIERLLVRLFAAGSRTLLVLGVLAFGLANPTPHAAATASTYQVAIIAAQAWLLLGVLVAFDAVWHAGSAEARAWRLPLAGTCFALALASRISVALAIAAIVFFTAVAEAWPAERRFRRFVLNALALGLPLTVTGFALLTYNKLRFDDWLEFGTGIQLSGFPRIRFAAKYVIPNLYSYTFRSWRTSCSFPYLNQIWNAGFGAFPRGMKLPGDYQAIEPVVGWALAVPLAWIAPLGFVLAPWRTAFSNRRDRSFVFCLLTFATLASLTGLIALGVYGTTMRYLNDIGYGMVLLALLGGYALRFRQVGAAVPRAATGLLFALGVPTIVIGLLLGYQGYNNHFRLFNPRLDAKIVKATSLCGARGPTKR